MVVHTSVTHLEKISSVVDFDLELWHCVLKVPQYFILPVQKTAPLEHRKGLVGSGLNKKTH